MKAAYRFVLVLIVVLLSAAGLYLPQPVNPVNPRDLQGVWTNATITPFERSRRSGGVTLGLTDATGR